MSTAALDLRGRMYRDRRLMQPAETAEFLRRQKVANVGTIDANGLCALRF
jgi:nitroimidazol reductase NimA-like FMN-containing flavoprotein (pyridoxamine 5'-phosphate oxidase superfamily)